MEICRDGICASWLQSSDSVPKPSSVGTPDAFVNLEAPIEASDLAGTSAVAIAAALASQIDDG